MPPTNNGNKTNTAQRPGPTATSEKQKAQKKRTRNLRRACWFFAVMSIGEMWYMANYSPVMSVRDVSVVGATDKTLTQQEKQQISDICKLKAHTNWVHAPTHAIAKQLNALPYVKHATAASALPLNVEVKVTIRQPAYVVTCPSGAYEMDADRTPIRHARPVMLNALKTIEFLPEIPLKPGIQVKSDSLAMASQLIHTFDSDRLLHIAKINIDPLSNIWLNVDNGLRIKFGGAVSLPEKVAAIRNILSQDSGHGERFAELNVTSPEYPACRLKVEVAKAAAAAAAAARAAQAQAIKNSEPDSTSPVIQTPGRLSSQ